MSFIATVNGTLLVATKTTQCISWLRVNTLYASPLLLKLWRNHADRKHELAILDRQMEAGHQGHTQHLEEIQVQADVAESNALYAHATQPIGVKWVEALRVLYARSSPVRFLSCSPPSKPLLCSS